MRDPEETPRSPSHETAARWRQRRAVPTDVEDTTMVVLLM
jgi:hypothetical protein